MKKVKCFAAVIVLLAGLAAVPAMASDVAVSAGVDFNTAYVWRGQTFNDGMVAQPSLDVTKGGLDVNVWGNLDMSDYDGAVESGKFSEIDLTLSYGRTFGKVDASVGYIEYLFPTTEAGGADGTREFYLSLSTGLPAGFSTGLDFYYDVDEVNDFYSKLNLGYEYAINDKTTLSAGIAAAYAGDAYCADGSAGFYDYDLSLSLGYTLTDAWSISATINYVDAIDSDKLVDVKKGGPLDTKTYGGINISYAF